MIREINVGDILSDGRRFSNGKPSIVYVFVLKSKYVKTTRCFRVELLSLIDLKIYKDYISTNSRNSTWIKL